MIKIGRLLTAAGMLIGLAACTPKPTKSGIVGLWVERQEASSGEALTACAYIRFTDDGRFEAENIPEEYFIDRGLSPNPRTSMWGYWSLALSGDAPQISLEVSPHPNSRVSGGYSTALHIYMSLGGEYSLYAWGPSEDRIFFEKRTEVDC